MSKRSYEPELDYDDPSKRPPLQGHIYNDPKPIPLPESSRNSDGFMKSLLGIFTATASAMQAGLASSSSRHPQPLQNSPMTPSRASRRTSPSIPSIEPIAIIETPNIVRETLSRVQTNRQNSPAPIPQAPAQSLSSLLHYPGIHLNQPTYAKPLEYQYHPSSNSWAKVGNPAAGYRPIRHQDWPVPANTQPYTPVAEQKRRQAEQQAVLEAQTQAIQAQATLAQAQLKGLRRAEHQQARYKPYNLPKAEYNSRHEGKVDLWKKLQSGEMLSNPEMTQLFHSINLAHQAATTPLAKQQAERAFEYAEQLLAKNVASHSTSTDDRIHTTINGVSTPSYMAKETALADIQHFRKHDRHMSTSELRQWVSDNTWRYIDTSQIPYEPGVIDELPQTVTSIIPFLRAGRLAGSALWNTARTAYNLYRAYQANQRVIRFASAKKIQKKYKHAGYFGIKLPYRPKNGELFARRVIEHVKNPDTQLIKGTYRTTIPTNHYYNPHTQINVMTTPSGEFISGWRLSSDQISNLLKGGNLQ